MMFAFANPDKIPQACGENAGEVNVTVRLDNRTVFRGYVTYKQAMNYKLDVKNADTLVITADKGRNGPECDWFILKNIEID